MTGGPFRIVVGPRARKSLARLDPAVRRRVAAAVDGLAGDPHPPGCKALRGAPAFRVRVGDYRVLYTVDHEAAVVEVIDVGHRKDIYR